MPEVLDLMPGVAVGDAAVVKLVDNTLSARSRTVRNDGPDPAWVSRNPQVTPTGADSWQIILNASQVIVLGAGEGLYAICAAGKSASLEVI